MNKAFIAAATAVALAGTGFALTASAQSQSGEPRQERAQRPALTQSQIAAFAEVRIARLKAGLMLTAEQEKNWSPVESVMRDAAKRAADRLVAWRNERAEQKGQVDAIARLGRISTALTERATDLKKFADAARPLYDSLDERQKERFATLVRRGGRRAFRDFAEAGRGERGGWHRGWQDGDGPRWRRDRDSND